MALDSMRPLMGNYSMRDYYTLDGCLKLRIYCVGINYFGQINK